MSKFKINDRAMVLCAFQPNHLWTEVTITGIESDGSYDFQFDNDAWTHFVDDPSDIMTLDEFQRDKEKIRAKYPKSIRD